MHKASLGGGSILGIRDAIRNRGKDPEINVSKNTRTYENSHIEQYNLSLVYNDTNNIFSEVHNKDVQYRIEMQNPYKASRTDFNNAKIVRIYRKRGKSTAVETEVIKPGIRSRVIKAYMTVINIEKTKLKANNTNK